jgi:hypothetical protein
VATQWGLEQHVRGISLEGLIAARFVWQPGWEYVLDA